MSELTPHQLSSLHVCAGCGTGYTGAGCPSCGPSRTAKAKDGGPAFPLHILTSYADREAPKYFHGMSLRDYFAAHCPETPPNYPWDYPMAKVGDGSEKGSRPSSSPAGTPIGPAEKMSPEARDSKWAWQYADAMLARRNTP